MTTTDEKIQAVEAFLDWRENTDPTAALTDQLVERWRSALEIADAATLLAEYRKDAAFAKGNAEDALKLAERIVDGIPA